MAAMQTDEQERMIELPAESSSSVGQPTGSLRGRAMKASAWMLAATPVNRVIQLGRSMVLTRLLSPSIFGIVALMGVVLQGLNMCSDVGLGPSIIQHARGKEERFLQTAWTIQILRGLGLWLIVLGLAWPVAQFYNQPELIWLMPVAGLGGFIGAFNTTAWQTHSRDLDVGPVVILAQALQLVALVVIIALAWWLRNVWALVLAGVISSLLHVIFGHVFLRGVRHRFCWDRGAVKHLVHFGKWIFLSTILTFLAMQSDKLLLGKLIDIDLLGVYSIALVLAAIPRDLVQQLAGGILFPVLAEKARLDSHRLYEKLTRARGVLLRIGLLLTLGMVVTAPAFFHWFYDSRYWDAGWIAQLLGLSVWMTVMNSTTSNALLAMGDSRALARGNLCNFAVTAVAAILGYYWFKLPGFILGYAVGTAAGELVYGLAIRRHQLGVLKQDARFTAAAALAMGAVILAWHVIATDTDANHIQTILFKLFIGLVIWGVVAAMCWPTLKHELLPNLRIGRQLGRLGQKLRGGTR